jgi:hypothetical protein
VVVGRGAVVVVTTRLTVTGVGLAMTGAVFKVVVVIGCGSACLVGVDGTVSARAPSVAGLAGTVVPGRVWAVGTPVGRTAPRSIVAGFLASRDAVGAGDTNAAG